MRCRNQPGWPGLTVLCCAAMLGGCAGDRTGLDANGRPPDESGPPGTEGDFRLIQDTVFTPICTQCHAGAAAPAGLRLDVGNSYALLVNVPSDEVPSILRVNPGDPDNSYLVQKIEGPGVEHPPLAQGEQPLHRGGPLVPAFRLAPGRRQFVRKVAVRHQHARAGGGPDSDTGKQFTVRLEYVQPLWRIGASGLHNNTHIGDRTAGALLAGAHWRSFSLLGELQYIDDEGFSGGRSLMASLAEVNWLPREGHNLKLTCEWFEPDREVDEDEQTRTSLLYEWSPMQFLQARFDVRYYDGIPPNDFQNCTQVLVQMHGYF